MTYPSGGPSYPPPQPQQHGPYVQTPQFTKVQEGPSNLPVYLLAAVVVLGVASYLLSFGPLYTATTSGPFGGTDVSRELGFWANLGGLGLPVLVLLLGALLAATSLLPKQSALTGAVAAISVLGFLAVLAELLGKPSGASAGWALLGIVVLGGLQAAASIGALLLDAEVITAPVPRPKYEYTPYGAPGQYYGQPQTGGHLPLAGDIQQHDYGQRPGYPPYGGYQSAPSTGGYQIPVPQSGPPTPPTGFPSYLQPPSAGPSAPGQQQPQQRPQQSQHQSLPTESSGPAPS